MTEKVDQAGSEEGSPALRYASVATSHPRAVKAAQEVLQAGGHAVEAAIAASLTLGVVDPMSTSLGGDAFALVWDAESKTLLGLNGSGRAPQAADPALLLREGAGKMPTRGIQTVTVPGALRAYGDLHERWGKLPWAALCKEAIDAALGGFQLTEAVAELWQGSEECLREGVGTDCFLPGSKVPQQGDRVVLEELGDTLKIVASEGPDSLYTGRLAEALVKCAAELDGWIRAEDLSSHRSEWVQPVEASYRGHPVFTLPPNGQGLVVLQALRILEDFPLSDYSSEKRLHTVIEALKTAFADVGPQIGDPQSSGDLCARSLDEDHVESLRDSIGDQSSEVSFRRIGQSDTVYVATVDAEGNACSLISSICWSFGSGVVVPGTGVVLQNRGALFDLDEESPGKLAPGRRPYHTIVPSMAFRMSRPWLVFGVVGGFQQPQGQLQLLSRIVDEAESVENAVASPRWRWAGGQTLWVEEPMSPELVEALIARGHRIADPAEGQVFGGAQCLLYDADASRWRGASDPRKDGLALTFEVR